MHQLEAVLVPGAADDAARPRQPLLPARVAAHVPRHARRARHHALQTQLVRNCYYVFHQCSNLIVPFSSKFFEEILYGYLTVSYFHDLKTAHCQSLGIHSYNIPDSVDYKIRNRIVILLQFDCDLFTIVVGKNVFS